MDLPINKIKDSEKWIRAGVAAFLSLSD